MQSVDWLLISQSVSWLVNQSVGRLVGRSVIFCRKVCNWIETNVLYIDNHTMLALLSYLYPSLLWISVNVLPLKC